MHPLVTIDSSHPINVTLPPQLQVSMLADELTRKLQYLHISNEGVSDLQVLNIQLQVGT